MLLKFFFRLGLWNTKVSVLSCCKTVFAIVRVFLPLEKRKSESWVKAKKTSRTNAFFPLAARTHTQKDTHGTESILLQTILQCHTPPRAASAPAQSWLLTTTERKKRIISFRTCAAHCTKRVFFFLFLFSLGVQFRTAIAHPLF